jgi:anti-sigma regulatory factor (Ser/Thr protein kinase)
VPFEYRDFELLSLTDDLRRGVALDALLRPTPRYAEGTELMVAAGTVKRIDVVAGTAIRLRIARHLRLRAGGVVTLTPPKDATVAEHLLELLSPLPGPVTVTASPSLPDRPRFGLVPATSIPDSDAAINAATFALEACDAARISDRRAALAAKTVMELADNALRHAGPLSDPPVVAATVSGRERLIEVAVTDPGETISESKEPRSALSAMPGARDGQGFLNELLRQGAKYELDVFIEALAGTARLRWTRRAHRTEHAPHVPGTTVVVRIASRSLDES